MASAFRISSRSYGRSFGFSAGCNRRRAAITAGATLAGAIVTWLKDRNGAARRIQALDEAQKYIEFWTTAKATMAPTAPPDELAAAEKAFRERVASAEHLVEARGTYRTSRYSPLFLRVSVDIIRNFFVGFLFIATSFVIMRLIHYLVPEWSGTFVLRALNFFTYSSIVVTVITTLIQSIRDLLLHIASIDFSVGPKISMPNDPDKKQI